MGESEVDTVRVAHSSTQSRHAKFQQVDLHTQGTEAAMSGNEEKYLSLLENIPDVVWTTDWDGHYVYVSANVEKVLGYTQKEMLSEEPSNRMANKVHSEDSQKVKDALSNMCHGGSRLDVEFRYKKKNGQWIWVNARAVTTYEKGGVRLLDGLTSDISERKLAEEELRCLSLRLVELQESERQSIARELHDDLGQSLTALKLMIENAMSSSPEKSQSILAQSRTIVQDLMARVRARSLDLWPRILEEMGLLPALVWHFDRYISQTQIEVQFDHFNLSRPIPQAVSTASYRIIQEALTNVARHSGAKKVAARVWTDDKSIYMVIEDQGVGFSPEAVKTRICIGLRSMQERAIALGGAVRIDSASGEGTIVRAELPLRNVTGRQSVEAGS